MSYSRWSHSRWYTFWHCESGKSRDNQAFAIYDAKGETCCYDYDDLEGITVDGLRQWFEGTDAELTELLVYVTEWLNDVREEYPETE